MTFNPQAPLAAYVSVSAEQQRMQAPATREAIAAQRNRGSVLNTLEADFMRDTSSPRDEISCLLSLVQPPAWMRGLWADVKGGWHDARTNTFLSFDDARKLIDARIAKLSLSPELVHAFPQSHSLSTIEEHQAFWRLSFEDRMRRFKSEQVG